MPKQRRALALADAAQLADAVPVELAQRDAARVRAHSTPSRYGYSG